MRKKIFLCIKAAAVDVVREINDHRDTHFYGVVSGAAVSAAVLGVPAVSAVLAGTVVVREGARAFSWLAEPESMERKRLRALSIMVGGAAMFSAIGGAALLTRYLMGSVSSDMMRQTLGAWSSLAGPFLGCALIPGIRNQILGFYKGDMFNAPLKARRKAEEEKRFQQKERGLNALEFFIKKIHENNLVSLDKTLAAVEGKYPVKRFPTKAAYVATIGRRMVKAVHEVSCTLPPEQRVVPPLQFRLP